MKHAAKHPQNAWVHVRAHGWVHGLKPHLNGAHGSFGHSRVRRAHTTHTPTRPHSQNNFSHMTRMTPVHPCAPCRRGADPCTQACTPRAPTRALFSLHAPKKKGKEGGKR